MEKITVLMSTYNGEKYLSEQIESILNQKEVEVKLIIRDDGSSDGTVGILREFEQKHDNIEIIVGQKNLGACGSFFDLICNHTCSDYYALSDQDDIWDDDKLIRAVSVVSKLPADKPALYFSNLRVVDENMNVCRMFYDNRPAIKNRYSGLIDSFATGCTMLYNKKMAEIAYEVHPTKFSMHDAWLFNVANLFGRVYYDSKPHISYRQHENNVIGAKIKINKIEQFKNNFKRLFRTDIHPYSDNAKVIYNQFAKTMSQYDKEYLKALGDSRGDFLSRFKVIFNSNFATKDMSRNMMFRILLLFGLA